MISTRRPNSAPGVWAVGAGAGRRGAGGGVSGMATSQRARRAMLASMVMSEQPAVSFTAFIMSLGTTAAVHFGDVPDPVSGASTTNLAAAGQMIDILAMLQEKTQGNLTPEEANLVGSLLYELRLRYVDASQAGTRIITP